MFSRLFKFGLTTQIVLAATLAGALSIAALTFLMYQGSVETLVERDTERLSRSLDVSVSRSLSAFEFYRQDTLLLVKTPPIQGIFRARSNVGIDPLDGSTERDWRDRLATIFTGVLDARPEYGQVRFIGTADGGRELVRVDRERDGTIRRVTGDDLQQKGHRPYFRETLALDPGQVFISDVELNQERQQIELPHRPVIRVATPVVEQNGEPLGIVIINIDMNRMIGEIEEQLSGRDQLFIANQRGDYLYHPDQSKAFGFDLGRRFLLQDEFPELAGMIAGRVEKSASIIDHGSGRVLSVAGKIRFDPMDPSRYLVVSQMRPTQELEQHLLGVRNQALWAAVAVLLFGMLVTVWLVGTLTRPLTRIARAADRVAKGERNADLGATGVRRDEVGVLARSFETMVKEVQAREDALRESEAKTSRLIDVIPEAVLVVDRDGVIRRVNKQVVAIFGHDEQAMLGQPVEMLIPERSRGGHVEKRHGYAAAPTIRPMGAGRDLFGLHRDGHEIPVEIALAPLDEGGREHIVVSVVDITERKAAERALRETNEKLMRTLKSNQELSQFAYVASHDLQEPLRMVDSYMGLLQRRYGGKLDSDADEFIGYAVDGARRMKCLISDLLEYSRVSSNRFSVSQVDMNAAAASVLEMLGEKLEEAGGKVEIGPLPTIPADRGQIDRLLTNLIGNAIKFRGDNPPFIRIGAKRKGSMWEFTVADNGIGIDPEFRTKVFEIFQRLHARDDYEGTGIGLASCKRIVELHGGTIWVTAAPGGGSEFHFTLPERQDEEQD